MWQISLQQTSGYVKAYQIQVFSFKIFIDGLGESGGHQLDLHLRDRRQNRRLVVGKFVGVGTSRLGNGLKKIEALRSPTSRPNWSRGGVKSFYTLAELSHFKRALLTFNGSPRNFFWLWQIWFLGMKLIFQSRSLSLTGSTPILSLPMTLDNGENVSNSPRSSQSFQFYFMSSGLWVRQFFFLFLPCWTFTLPTQPNQASYPSGSMFSKPHFCWQGPNVARYWWQRNV